MTTQPLASARHLFTVDEFNAMVRAGILAEDARVELIDGEVLDMPPVGDRHISLVDRIADTLYAAFRDVAIVRVQSPVKLGVRAQPMPDVTLLRRRPDFYRDGPPAIADVLLVVEVGDTTADSDRRDKAPFYARLGVPELWLYDVGRDWFMVCRDPSPDGYRSAQTYRRGERIALTAYPDREVEVTDLLGGSR